MKLSKFPILSPSLFNEWMKLSQLRVFDFSVHKFEQNKDVCGSAGGSKKLKNSVYSGKGND